VLRIPSARLGELVELGVKSAWYRTFLDEFLPELERVIYLDADVVVVAELGALWRTELGGNLVGAVSGAASESFDPGVLLLDLAALRAAGALERVRTHAATRREGAAPVQGALNAIVADRWLALDPRWNDVTLTRERPAILHFAGPRAKPWLRGADGPGRDLYWRHRNAPRGPPSRRRGSCPQSRRTPGILARSSSSPGARRGVSATRAAARRRESAGRS